MAQVAARPGRFAARRGERVAGSFHRDLAQLRQCRCGRTNVAPLERGALGRLYSAAPCEEGSSVKKDIHPDYHEITVVMTDGSTFKTRST